MDYYNNFPMSDNVKKCRAFAHQIAVQNRNKYVEPIHLLYAMYNTECVSAEILRREGLSPVSIVAEIGKLEKTDSLEEPEESEELKVLFDDARKIAIISKQDCIYTEHLLLASVFYEDSPLNTFLSRNIDVARMLRRLEPNMNISNIMENLNNMPSQSYGGAKQNGSGSSLPKEISDLGVDFTQRAKEGKIDPVIGRKNEIERIIEILCRKTKNNPVLIGEPGVGKSAVVEGLALEIAGGNVPELLKNKIIFSLDIGSLMAGTKYRGELEQRLKTAIDAIIKRGDIIVFIDELHTLAQAGGKEGEVTPADMLKPYLARGELQTIGATTTDEYRKFIETDKALERRFQPIMVDPPTVEQTIEILKGIRPNYEAFHKVKITDEAITAAAQLSDRYISDRFLPDKAIDLIDEAASRAKVNGNKLPPEIKDMEEKLDDYQKQIDDLVHGKEDYINADKVKKLRDNLAEDIKKKKAEWQAHGGGTVGAEEIAEVVAKWTKIPVTRLNETETERLNNLEKILHERVIGQDQAVVSVAKAIRRARAGLKDPKRPIGSFLFLGPTGVGKTELTKALAAAMFDDENNIIRIDMSEYMEAHSVSKLIGSPPGYVGFDEGGQLTEQVRRKPYSVVLFDEIEKAHPDVYNILLQVLDEGRLTDSQGRTVDFKNTIIIMTSNVGVSELKTRRAIGFNDDKEAAEQQDEERILSEALKRHFRPEFLNRIDVICYFKHLTEENIKAIADLMMRKVTKKLDDRNIKLKYTSAIVGYVIKNGYDPEYGARPLRRIIEQTIEDSIADALLSGKIKDNSTAIIDYVDGKVVVKPSAGNA